MPENSVMTGEAIAETPDLVLIGEICPDVLQEIRYYSTYNFVGKRIDGYLEPVALMERSAALALKAASAAFVDRGYVVKVYDAYRPQRAVRHFVRWAEDEKDTAMQRIFYPDLPKCRLIPDGYIAPRSSHSRGGTVDLTLVDRLSGREVDMGGVFDFFGARSNRDHEDLTKEQIRNRRLLRAVMEDHGFGTIASEWWHFTYAQERYPDTVFDVPVCSASAMPCIP